MWSRLNEKLKLTRLITQPCNEKGSAEENQTENEHFNLDASRNVKSDTMGKRWTFGTTKRNEIADWYAKNSEHHNNAKKWNTVNLQKSFDSESGSERRAAKYFDEV